MKSNWPGVHDTVRICRHAAEGRRPILSGRRDVEVAQGHSGWWFQCGAQDAESTCSMEIRSVKDVITSDPTVCYIIDSPFDTVVERKGSDEEWVVTSRWIETPS